MKTNCEKFIESYLPLIGIGSYVIKSNTDNDSVIISIEINKNNKEHIGILKGKEGRNLLLIKKIIQVIGLHEHIKPFLIIRLVD